jgi:hypothetical protein
MIDQAEESIVSPAEVEATGSNPVGRIASRFAPRGARKGQNGPKPQAEQGL